MKFLLIFFPILDWRSSNPAFHGRFCHSHRYCCNESWIKGLWDDVIFSEGKFGCPIGNVHLLGNRFFGQGCKCMNGSHFHGFVNFGSAHIQCAPKYEWKTKHIINLIWEVRSASSHNRVLTCGNSKVIVNFGIRICHGKNDWIWRHSF